MRYLLALLVMALAAAASPAQEGGGGALMNLSCIEALVAIDADWLAGVFSFVPEKDSPTAFADIIVRNKAAMKRYLGKLSRDYRAAKGISEWDHEVVMKALELYGSPLAEAVGKPDSSVRERLGTLSLAPTMSLGELSMRRKGG
ncbi:MAG: hypothetical protein HY927_16305 [Elusimicrobia bacterium]|nr:hypothetical protein [Elusimicrobiota bacterium]